MTIWKPKGDFDFLKERFKACCRFDRRKLALLGASLVFYCSTSWLVEHKFNSDFESARAIFKREQTIQASSMINLVQDRFDNLYSNLRMLGRLPESKDSSAQGASNSLLSATHEVFLSLNSSVGVKGLYVTEIVVGSRDRCFPRILTGYANAPTTGPVPTTQFDLPALQERIQHQMDWYRQMYAYRNLIADLEYPALGSEPFSLSGKVITGTSTQFFDSDTAIAYSVPFYDDAGLLSGLVTAVIPRYALASQFPDGDYGVVARDYFLSAAKPGGEFSAHDQQASRAQPIRDAIFSHAFTLNVVDAGSDWKLWVSRSQKTFEDRPEIVSAEQFRHTGHLFTLLAFILMSLASMSLRSSEPKAAPPVVEDKSQEEELLRRLESMGRLASGIAHEINSPMQFIGDNTRYLESAFGKLLSSCSAYDTALTQIAQNGAKSEYFIELEESLNSLKLPEIREEVPNAIQESLEGIARVLEIVRAMKEFSHPGLKLVRANVNQILENTATVTRYEWRNFAKVEFQLQQNMPQIECNPSELGQVFLNLMINAIQAIREKGKEHPGVITITSALKGDFVEIQIADSGVGIAPESQSRVFDQFFTTKEIGTGTGLGLSTAMSIVRGHHGEMTFQSRFGVGTTFTVRLPLQVHQDKEVAA